MTGLGYTLPAVLAVVFVVAWEVGVLRTGVFRRPAYWISRVIVATRGSIVSKPRHRMRQCAS